VQIHGMDADPFFALEGDLDAARELVASIGPELGELFTYPGDRHLFTDSSLPSYDREATESVLQRSREFLARLG
jgi:dienelactone hydrolase